MNFVDDSIEDKALTIGAAMPNTEVKIIDPDTGDTVPIGEVGEPVRAGLSRHGGLPRHARTGR